MAALDYFTGAARDWRDEASKRLDILIERRGNDAERYIAKRLDRTTWGSFERRRWTYIATLLERRERVVNAPRLERAFIDLRSTGDDDDREWPEHRTER